MVVPRSRLHRSLTRNSIAIFTVSRAAGLLAVLAEVVVLVAVLAGCQGPGAQEGGQAATTIQRLGFSNSVTLRQSDNPAERSNHTVESEHTVECLLPQGTGLSLTDRGTGGGSALAPSFGYRVPGSSLFERLIPRAASVMTNSHQTIPRSALAENNG
jgi:hypothetical protein